MSFELDITNLSERHKVFNTIRLVWGKINLLVCAHGASARPFPFQDISVEEYSRVMNTDVLGTLGCCQEVVPIMKGAGNGSIVLISSFHIRGTYPYRTVYSLAKSGVSSLARSLCVEHAKYGININCIAPGQVDNQRSHTIAEDILKTTGQNVVPMWKSRMPSGKLVDSEDIATAVQFLANCPSINGQTIYLDGGATSSLWYQGH
jgi:2-hydroxycyclohexanecarboxyl-CoA dehydrogenase